MSGIKIPNQRDVIDRRELAAAIAAQVADEGARPRPPGVVELLRDALAKGREELAARARRASFAPGTRSPPATPS